MADYRLVAGKAKPMGANLKVRRADKRASGRAAFASEPASDELDAVFERLVANAFEFLDRAIRQVETERKHSIINFATAIELFLKARLFREHWSLVADGPAPDRARFLAGAEKTVTPATALSRLERTCGDPVPKVAADEFKRLAEHRNKAIHFFHEADDPTASKEALEATVTEQFRGWHHLEELLRSWSSHLGEHRREIDRITFLMRRHGAFLAARFEAMQPALARETAGGAVFANCASCGFEAAKVRPLTTIVATLSCRVCGVTDARLTFDCLGEDCGQQMLLSSHAPGQRWCKNCNHVHDNDEIRELLDDMSPLDDLSPPINCAACTTLRSGVEHEEIFVCAECLVAERHAPQCGWCAERQIGGGDLRDSEWRGCEFCDGRSGWDRD